MRRSRSALVILAVTLLTSSSVGAYLKLGLDVNGRTVGVRWSQMPIRYFITNRDINGVTAPQLQTVVQQGLDTWAKVPTVTMSSQFVGFTNADPSVDDGISAIG